MSNEAANSRMQSDRLLSDPAACYGTPEALLNDVALTKEQKVAALRSWAYDAVEADVALEEGMPSVVRRDLWPSSYSVY